jgi:hypothetical protein
MLQADTSGFGEFGVESQNLYRELDFVDDALSGSVPAAKQFKVRKIVVSPVSIPVMHRLVGEQVAFEMLGHHIPMFHDVLASRSSKNWDRYPSVSVALYVGPVVSFVKAIYGLLRLVVDFAFLVAKFLLEIETASGFTPFASFFAAAKADESVLFFGRLFSTFGRARNRAVQWLVSKFLFVGVQIRLDHRKGVSAFFAVKRDGVFRGGRRVESVAAAARYAAELLVFARVAVEHDSTIQARFLKWHGLAPLFATKVSLLMPLGEVK